MMSLRNFAIATLAVLTLVPQLLAVEAPRLLEKNGRYTLLVEGRPFLMLGGQIHNSSAWPSELPQVWQSLTALHANTIEAPVYWEQFEPQPGHFDFSNVDQIVEGARAHDLHVVLLWFGTWKNGNMHYVPSWVKADTKRFPRTIRLDGEPTDVLSPNARTTLEADKTVFTALMHHLKQIDGEQHTVLMMQVENESGNIGSVRDFSAEANQEFAGPVPADLLAVTHKQPGTWNQVIRTGSRRDLPGLPPGKIHQRDCRSRQSRVAIPCYINVWVSYPVAELPQTASGHTRHSISKRRRGPKVRRHVESSCPRSSDMIGPDIY